MKAVVSICVPNLNALPFLPERFETIFQQTYQNWELLIYDNYSDDGSWEFFEKLARKDQRISIAQAPREGMYANWNNCLRRARGKYVYMATSDDTMSADCLEKLVAALEEHQDCDLAHCRLRAIDESGRNHEVKNELWETLSTFARSSGDFIGRPHVRRAPYDGLLHLLGETVYVSITQLLIRRSLFDRIGLFESKWGSVGDFNWGMRAGLVANTIHVPDTWGGWRIHPQQATSTVVLRSTDHAGKIESMIDHAIGECMRNPPLHLRKPVAQATALGAFLRDISNRTSLLERRAVVVLRLLAGSAAARAYLRTKLGLPSAPDLMRNWLENTGSGPVLIALTGRLEIHPAALLPNEIVAH